MLRVAPPTKKPEGLVGELESMVAAVKGVSWTALEELKGDSDVLKKLDDAEAMLKSLRKTLADGDVDDKRD